MACSINSDAFRFQRAVRVAPVTITIFFSWQADTETKQGRNFIERALQRAIISISKDIEWAEAEREEIEIDRDTKGVSGSPPIVDTIFRKIDGSAIFLPDLTFVGKRYDNRPTPNPNVMIEYGWALKSLGHSRIIPVMNIAHGEPTAENMPFDLRHLRNPILYSLPDAADEDSRKRERIKLARALETAIRAVLKSDEYAAARRAPELPVFSGRNPEEGRARFRKKGEPIAFNDDEFSQERGAIQVRLADGPAFWIRVMPRIDSGTRFKVVDLKSAATQSNNFLLPIRTAANSFNYMRGADGFGIFSLDTRYGAETNSIVYAFQSGEVWSIDSGLLKQMHNLPYLEAEFARALESYSDFLKRLSIEKPHKWVAGIEGLAGKGISFPPRPGHILIGNGAGMCHQDYIEAEGVFEEGMTSLQALKPFFVSVFDAFGLERSDHLDEVVSTRLSR